MSKVEVDQAAIRTLWMDPDVQDDLIWVAEEAAKAAKTFAPRKTGSYRDSIHVEHYPGDGRVVIIASDFKSNWIEFGTKNQQGDSKGFPIHAPLRRGCEAVGLHPHGGRS